jgi:hypothetical protein
MDHDRQTAVCLRRDWLRRKDVQELTGVTAIGNTLARRYGRPGPDIGGHHGYGDMKAAVGCGLKAPPGTLLPSKLQSGCHSGVSSGGDV